MGNVTKRMVGTVEARVMRPDGIVVDYKYPIQVAMLMTLYPDYMVIHCSGEGGTPGERAKIKIMDLEDRVALGESYIMYPIPPQHKETFKTAASAPLVQEKQITYSRYLKTKISLGRKRSKRGTKVKFDKRKRSWRITFRARTFVSSLFRRRSSASGYGRVSTEGGWMPLLDCDGNVQRFASTPVSKLVQDCLRKPNLAVESSYWKPDLDVIPESRPESPNRSR